MIQATNKPWPPSVTRDYLEHGLPIDEVAGPLRARLRQSDDADYLFFAPVPEADALYHYYNSDYHRTRHERWLNAVNQYVAERWDGLVAELVRLFPRRAGHALRIHDVGCGYGGLVARLNEQGFQATGSEIISAAVLAARTECANHAVFEGTAFDVLGDQPDQDVIVLHHVLEHLPDPLGALSQLRRHLAPGGHLVLRVPNRNYILTRTLGVRAHWYGFPNHLHYFGGRSLGALARAAGFIPRSIACTTTEMFQPGLLNQLREHVEPPGDRGDHQIIEHLVRTNQTKELQLVACVPDRST